jgi:hypothetical protein
MAGGYNNGHSLAGHLRFGALQLLGRPLMAKNDLEKALAHVSHDRRGFFRALLIGSGAAAVALPLMTSQSLAQKEGEDPGPDGKCDPGLVVGKKTGKCKMPKKAPPTGNPPPGNPNP